MKTPKIKPQGINQIADNITRSASEHEDIDLAADATASAPAKTLQVDRPVERRYGRSRTVGGNSRVRPKR